MRVLVTGAKGQLGTDLVRTCREAGDDVIACSRAELDLMDRDSVLAAITSARPDIVLNAGAWTAVDACESDPERAYRTNAMGVRWVTDAARLTGSHVLHVSTDYVFDGTKHEPYHEWDDPNPRSVYGRSKLGGEREADPSHTVVRTSWVCGAHGPNMVKTVLALIDQPERKGPLAFVDDQHGCPSFTADLAPTLRRLAVARMAGTFHVTNQGPTTWYGFVRDILELAGSDPSKVRPIATADLDPPRAAPRPANSVLDNAALRHAGLPQLPHYRDALERLVRELRA
jgi:dTDP-4-dehydrorhamnose reductase